MKSYSTCWLTQQVVLLDTEQHQTIKSRIGIGKVMLLLDVKLAVNVSSVHAALYYIHDLIYAVSWGEESLVYMSKASTGCCYAQPILYDIGMMIFVQNVQLQFTSTLNLPLSAGGINLFLAKDISSFGLWIKVVESTVWHISLKSPIIELCCSTIAYDSHHFSLVKQFSDSRALWKELLLLGQKMFLYYKGD